MRKLFAGLAIGLALAAGVQIADAHWPGKADLAVVECALRSELYVKKHCEDHWHNFLNHATFKDS